MGKNNKIQKLENLLSTNFIDKIYIPVNVQNLSICVKNGTVPKKLKISEDIWL
jgi:hypothetical protein